MCKLISDLNRQPTPRRRYNNLKYSSRSKDWANKLDPVPDIEDLVSVGRAHNLCPFYMSRESAKVRVEGWRRGWVGRSRRNVFQLGSGLSGVAMGWCALAP